MNPDCIVVNLWDYDNGWRVEWLEDGKETIKGEHYFAAKPSDRASIVTVVIKNRFGKTWKEHIELKKQPQTAASIP